MKVERVLFRLLALTAIIANSVLCVHAQNQPGAPWQVRVMTYNVHHCTGLDQKLDYDRVAEVIAQQHPDVVALQEVDSMTFRSGQCNQLQELTQRILYFPVFAASSDCDGGKTGVGILTRERPLSITRVPLPGKEPRVLLVVELERCVIACTQLDFDEEQRLASVPVIEAEALRWNKPFVMAGDWNDTPDSKTVKEMKKVFGINTGKQNTYPANHPEKCVDYIASRGSRPVVSVYWGVVCDTLASSHRPYVSDLRFPLKAYELMATKPYLQDPQPTEMTVMFQTTAPAHCWVEYGIDESHLKRKRALLDGQEICYDIENRITLDSLQPGQRYVYRVCVVDLLLKHAYEFHTGDTLRTPFFSFKTPSEQEQDFTCVIFNDLHEYMQTFKYLNDTLRFLGIQPDFVFFNGDCLHEPLDRKHAMRMIHRLADPVNAAEIPVFFIRGNHEIRNFYSAGMHSLIGYPNDKTYGGVSWGDTRFVILDCGEDKPDDHKEYAGFNDFTQLRAEETAFIRQELKSRAFKKAKRRILISHIPIFGCGDEYTPCSDAWRPLLCDQPFDVAVFGHNHRFQYVEKGFEGAMFPVLIGGGPQPQNATVSVLQKKGNQLHLKVISRDPKKCLDVDL